MKKSEQAVYQDLVPQIGKAYYFRTLSDHWVGRVSAVASRCVCLEEAAWIAESGRLYDFVAEGRADGMEVEPVGQITIYFEAFLPWPHRLLKEQV